MNAAMLKEGAIAADLKPSVFGALVNKEVSVKGILKDPAAVQGKLDSFRERFMADSKIGAKASEILKSAMERFGI